jgi:alpha-L-fucosidase
VTAAQGGSPNCPPNPAGLLDDNVVARLDEVGQQWTPDLSRPRLPAQGPQNDLPVTPVSATATSGRAQSAVDGINDSHYYTVWQSSEDLPQSVTLDLGEVQDRIGMLLYVPKYQVPGTPVADGSITAFTVLTSADGESYTEAATGTWESDPTMKIVTFEPVAARYVRPLVEAAEGGGPAATETSVGRAP